MNQSLKRAKWMILGGISMALGVAFWLPYSARPVKTVYLPMQGFMASFGTSHGAARPVSQTATVEKMGDVTQTAGKRSRVRPHNPRSTQAAAPSAPKSQAEKKPALPALPNPDIPLESIQDAYENELAKYPLDKTVWSEEIELRLLGICPWKDQYILKVAVSNNTAADFFVKGFAIRSEREALRARSFFRLFVEPGNTREGYVLFDKPHPNAQVKITLKEDGHNGRTLEIPIHYPF